MTYADFLVYTGATAIVVGLVVIVLMLIRILFDD